jgi:LysM repeat protein
LSRKRTLRGAVAVSLLLTAVGAAAQEPEARPQIFLEKTVYSDTVGGKRSVYETHTVEKGDSLWKILERKQPLTPREYAEKIREFRRANPQVADPSRLAPGQKILVPTGGRENVVEEGKAVAYDVKRGDTLSGILASRSVAQGEWKQYFDAVREMNPSVRDVNLIYAGAKLLLPTEEYFTKAPVEVAGTEPGHAASAAGAGEPATAQAPQPAREPEIAALPRDVPAAPAREELAPGKPQAELVAPKAAVPEAPIAETGKRETSEEAVTAPASFPYRGLLSDLLNALGEKWIESGTLYLPLPAGGEVLLQLSAFPLVRFAGGVEALLDFGNGLPPRVRDAITDTWSHMRVVPLGDANGAAETIDRVLRVSGYYSVKEGVSHPVVIGEAISVVLPARWVVQRTEESLLSGDLVLIKETPERPDAQLVAVLRYARRVGVRVLPFADDPGAREGFLVGIGEEPPGEGTPVALVVPSGGGLPAVDFCLSFLGIPASKDERLRIGGKGNSFQLVVQPERVFEAQGRKYVVDAGTMSPALRTILKDSGYTVFTVGKGESGREIFERLARVAGGTLEERKERLLAGGGKSGFAVRVTGAFLTFPGKEGAAARDVVLVPGRVHSATRALLRDLGVEIVEW